MVNHFENLKRFNKLLKIFILFTFIPTVLFSATNDQLDGEYVGQINLMQNEGNYHENEQCSGWTRNFKLPYDPVYVLKISIKNNKISGHSYYERGQDLIKNLKSKVKVSGSINNSGKIKLNYDDNSRSRSVHPFRFSGKFRSDKKLTFTPVIQNRECYIFKRIILTKQGDESKLAETKKENISPEETNSVNKTSQNVENISSDITISYCRPKAVTRFAENILLYIDEKVVVKIRSGTSGVNKIAIGQVIKFGNKANIFMMRGSDQTAYEEKITENKNHFYLVKAKANIAQGLGAMLGGSVLGNLVTKNQEDGGGKQSWDVKKLTKSDYESSCN